MYKRKNRTRRATKARASIRESNSVRLTVHRTPRHIYAQIIEPTRSEVVVCASTLHKAIRRSIKTTGNIEAAQAVGRLIAEQAVKAGIGSVAFDRSGFKYHGRVKALADAAREGGLKF